VNFRCILITPAHNEEAFIQETCESIAAQTLESLKWIVVDDASSDRTADIVARYQHAHPDRIELLRVTRAPGRDFRNKVRAFEVGAIRARQLGFEFIGNLDADISLKPDYYATMVACLEAQPKLGVVGGMVCTNIEGNFVSQRVSTDSVAGAVQLFKRACFEEIGGYCPLPLGGIDAAAEITARMKGWEVRTLAEVSVLENRRTGTALVSPLQARVREGKRLYSLGYSLPFFLVRCVRRSLERPKLIGSLAALTGFLGCLLRREPHVLSPEVIDFLRREQRTKLSNFFGFKSDSTGA